MKRNITFHPNAFNEFLSWCTENTKIREKIEQLIRDIQKTPFSGLGKPEPLKGNLTGYWSRRITQEHRLVYRIGEDSVDILQCRGHY